jgi:hypothetical protein
MCGYIRQWVNDNILNHINGEKYAKSLCDKFVLLYAMKTGNNKIYLIKKMLDLKLQEGTSCEDHLIAFQGIMNKLSAMGINFDDEIQCYFFSVRFDLWQTFRMSLSNFAIDC